MSKYIIARIDLPLEIFPDGKYETCQDHASIEFIKCEELPPKNDLSGIDFSKILKSMIFTDTNEDNDIPIYEQNNIITEPNEYIPKEIVLSKKKREPLRNSTIKNSDNNINKNKNNFSKKNYKSSSI